MFKMIIYKLSQMIIVLFILTTITFILMKLSPGNPVDKIYILISHVSHEQIETTENKLGLNNPIFIQWWHWLNQLFHFDLGTSYQTSEPVNRNSKLSWSYTYYYFWYAYSVISYFYTIRDYSSGLLP